MGIILSLVSMAFYMTETGLQMNDALTQSSLPNLIILLSFVVIPLIISNLISAVLVLRNMDFTDKNCGKAACAALHVCQLGLMWRCCKLFLLYDEKDWREFMTLRVLHTVLQSLPYVVTKGAMMLWNNDNTATSFASIIITIISSSLVLSMFNLRFVLFESDEFLDFKARRRKPFGIVFVLLGTFLILLSRCASILLMTSIFPVWVSVPLGTHFLLYILCSTLYMKCNGELTCKSFMINITFSYMAVYDAVISEFHRMECRYVMYYSVILVENIVMTATWMIASEETYVFKLSLVVVILASFIFGIIFKCCSCGYVQTADDSEEPISEDTLDFAKYITKAAAAEKHMMQNGVRSSSGRHRKTPRPNGSATLPGGTTADIEIHTIYSPDETGSPINKQRDKNISSSLSGSNSRENIVNAKLSKYKYAHNMRDGLEVRVKVSDSTGDVASNNSRNTNTINQCNKTRVDDIVEELELQVYNNRAYQSEINPSPSPKRSRQLMDVRSHSPNKIESDNICRSPQSKKNSYKKKEIPLFPNECNDLLGSKAFGSPKAKHILSNSVSEYHIDDSYSETSYSEYLSYSYYVDSTDWSSMSCGSDCAFTWPPSSKVEFVNLHCLPKEKISTTDSVHVWLSKLDDWEPSYDNQTFEFEDELINEITIRSMQNLTEAKDTDLVRRRSSIHGQRPDTETTDIRNIRHHFNTRDLDKYASEIAQIPPNSQTRVHTVIAKPNDVTSDSAQSRAPFQDRSPRDKPVVVWHRDIEENLHPDIVQESVV